MEDQKINTLETLIRIQELIRLTKKLKGWKVKALQDKVASDWYSKKLQHNIVIHDMVTERLEQRFKKLLSTLN
jgi:hypothetical protein